MLPKRIRDMHTLYGRVAGVRCGQCAHLVSYGYRSNTYFKCDLNRMTSGAATDWRKKWPACGKYRREGQS